MSGITFRGRQLWPRPRRARHARPEAPDPRSPLRRWEDGPDRPPAPRRPRPEIGSMVLDDEQAWRRRQTLVDDIAAGWQYRARCDDTGEHYGTVMMPRVGPVDGRPRLHLVRPGHQHRAGMSPGPVPHFCPRCEAPDDRPHYPGCPFYDADEAALFAEQLAEAENDVTAVLGLIEAQARTLDPAAWRPYLTADEFARTFPGVPYTAADDLGVSPADLAETAQLDPGHAEDILARQADHREYLAQRATAFALDRTRQIAAWRAIGR